MSMLSNSTITKLVGVLILVLIAYFLWPTPRTLHEGPADSLPQLMSPVTGEPLLTPDVIETLTDSPCYASLFYLAQQYVTDEKTYQALEAVDTQMQELPASYQMENPWKGNITVDGLVVNMLTTFRDWCTFLPSISGDQDNGLKYIQNFAWYYYKNPAAQAFVQGYMPDHLTPLETGFKFTRDFSMQRGAYMNTQASAALVPEWVEDPRIEITDYIPPAGDEYNYNSWNEFFARQIKIDTQNEVIPSRPVTMPEKDYVVSSPTDCIMNPLVQVLGGTMESERAFINNPLQADTVLDVKNIPIDLVHLLGHTPDDIKQKFVGGTGLSCVLMPNTYHHFHTPVSGEVVHAEVIEAGTYGYIDWPNWVPQDGNVGRAGTDFGQFEVFQRGVVIIKVTYKNVFGNEVEGYVASIPVGLDTIGSVVLDEDIVPGAQVKRGYTRLGNFFYGGSLNILLFSKGLATGAVQTRMGNQITLFDIGNAPE
ncbi:phosphatidylserine decarboxylase [Thalassolituus sp.]|uniref:phosphatidylserine decarboxylase n=1 Tax=Thalassolituus sp. TaxID=2030822 RepID=UPI002A81D974|nr:phosphatidylserine decarboxylase [Thalassolituus sp.]